VWALLDGAQKREAVLGSSLSITGLAGQSAQIPVCLTKGFEDSRLIGAVLFSILQ